MATKLNKGEFVVFNANKHISLFFLSDEPVYGVFEITQYNPDYFHDINYKCTLSPIKEYLDGVFNKVDFYTSDLESLIYRDCVDSSNFKLFKNIENAINYANSLNKF